MTARLPFTVAMPANRCEVPSGESRCGCELPGGGDATCCGHLHGRGWRARAGVAGPRELDGELPGGGG